VARQESPLKKNPHLTVFRYNRTVCYREVMNNDVMTISQGVQLSLWFHIEQ